MKLGHHEVGTGHPPFIVAEISGNHNKALPKAMAIVEAAARAGVHAIKLQTYTADTMTLPVRTGEFFIDDETSLWHGRSLYELYQEAHTPWEWHEPIMRRAQELGMIAFSTPFDETAVDFLEGLNVPCYKIASFENNDISLLRKVVATGKPVIISTGMASLSDLDITVCTLRNYGCNDFVLLKCTSAYPALPKDIHLRTIPHLQELFQCEVGLSDHTHGIGVAVAAVTLGATVVEKHFTLSRSEGGVDSAFSMEPQEMAALVLETERAWQALGHVRYGFTEAEKNSAQFRRSIYVARDLNAGEVITRDSLRIVRPGFGLAPKHYDSLLGRRIKENIPMGTAMQWSYVE